MDKTHRFLSSVACMAFLGRQTENKQGFPQIVRSMWSVSGEQRRLVGTGWSGKVSLEEVTFQLRPEDENGQLSKMQFRPGWCDSVG